MVSPGARCLNFVSPQCVCACVCVCWGGGREGEGGATQVINFSCSLSTKIDVQEVRRGRKELAAELLSTGDARKRGKKKRPKITNEHVCQW